MSQITRRDLTKLLEKHDFKQLPNTQTSHIRYGHPSGVVITVPGHGRANLSKKHVGQITRQLEQIGLDRKRIKKELGLIP